MKPVKTAKFVRRMVRAFGIQRVREGLVEYILDEVSGDEWEALKTRLECGQQALLQASTADLIEEIGDWDHDDESYERIEDHVRPKLEGDATPMEETK